MEEDAEADVVPPSVIELEMKRKKKKKSMEAGATGIFKL